MRRKLTKTNSLKIKTLDTKEEFINLYFDNWKKEILDNCIVVQCRILNKNLIDSNTFKVNPYILEFLDIEEINIVTSKLNNTFPTDKNKEFNRLMRDTQFYSYDNYKIDKNIKPIDNPCSMSDYSIFEMGDYILVFHLDIMYGLGVSINNIWKKGQINLKKDFVKVINI